MTDEELIRNELTHAEESKAANEALDRILADLQQVTFDLKQNRDREALMMRSYQAELQQAKAALERIDLLTENHVQTPEILVDTIHVLARQALDRETE